MDELDKLFGPMTAKAEEADAAYDRIPTIVKDHLHKVAQIGGLLASVQIMSSDEPLETVIQIVEASYLAGWSMRNDYGMGLPPQEPEDEPEPEPEADAA